MVDEFGRTDNKAQAIRKFDKLKLASLFDDIKRNPDKYPDSITDWIEWLNKDSGDSVCEL
jgi:hypothetical protein